MFQLYSDQLCCLYDPRSQKRTAVETSRLTDVCTAKASPPGEYLCLKYPIGADLCLRTDPGVIFQVWQSVLTTVNFVNEGNYRLSSW